jgi:hypothetical protein
VTIPTWKPVLALATAEALWVAAGELAAGEAPWVAAGELADGELTELLLLLLLLPHAARTENTRVKMANNTALFFIPIASRFDKVLCFDDVKPNLILLPDSAKPLKTAR